MKNGRTGVVRRLGWEGTRWFSPGILLAVVAVSVLCYLGDVCSDTNFIAEYETGELYFDAIHYFLGTEGLFMGIVSLCCVVFTGAGLYAQDYEENTVYMRVQRMGIKHYAGLRVMQLGFASWFVGCISILLVIPMVSLIFQVPLFPQRLEFVEGVSTSQLLQSGHAVAFMATLGILAGFRAVFYALVTFVISFFVPHRRVLVAIPMLLWYFNQYLLCRVEWIPWWLQPRTVFELRYGMLDFEGVSEWGALGHIAIGMLVLVLAVWGLFVLHLRRNGIFGGEQDE